MADVPPNWFYVERAVWKPARWPSRIDAQVKKGAEVFIHHSVTRTSDNPCHDMKAVEAVGIERFGRFSYSFAVHPSGVVLEGCGRLIGAHTEGRNSSSYGLVLLGDLTKSQCTTEAFLSLCFLVNLLRFDGSVAPNPRIRPHRAVKATACPGVPDTLIDAVRFFTDGRG